MPLHFNIATEGIKAGHKIFARLGFGFTVEVSAKPIDSGGGWPGFQPDITEYLVTVKITRRGKVWKQSFEATEFGLKSLERVILTFKGIDKVVSIIKVALTRPLINIQRILVKAKVKTEILRRRK